MVLMGPLSYYYRIKREALSGTRNSFSFLPAAEPFLGYYKNADNYYNDMSMFPAKGAFVREMGEGVNGNFRVRICVSKLFEFIWKGYCCLYCLVHTVNAKLSNT